MEGISENANTKGIRPKEAHFSVGYNKHLGYKRPRGLSVYFSYLYWNLRSVFWGKVCEIHTRRKGIFRFAASELVILRPDGPLFTF